jgi:hypothetical protein
LNRRRKAAGSVSDREEILQSCFGEESEEENNHVLMPVAWERRSNHPQTPRETACSLGLEGATTFDIVGRNTNNPCGEVPKIAVGTS